MKKRYIALLIFLINASVSQAMTKEEEEITAQIWKNRRGMSVVETRKQEAMEIAQDKSGPKIVSAAAQQKAADTLMAAGNDATKEDIRAYTVAMKEPDPPPAVPGTSAHDMFDKVADEAIESRSGKKEKIDTSNEFSAYVGAYRSMQYGSHGVWAMAEGIHWWLGQYEPTNFGLGATLKGDRGETKNGKYNWASIAFGPNFDYWTELGLGADHLLIKARPLYRWKKGGKKGFMPGGYAEFDHALGQYDTLIGTLDGQYFPKDSYLGASLMWEHQFTKDLKVKGGINVSTDFTGSSGLAAGPGGVVKYGYFEAGGFFSLINALSSGVYVGINFNDWMRDQYSKEKRESVTEVPADQIEQLLENPTKGKIESNTKPKEEG